MNPSTAWVCVLCCLLAAAQALSLDERASRHHTYELRLQRSNEAQEDELIRAVFNGQLTENAVQLVGIDAVTSTSIALTATRGNRPWTTYYGEIIVGNVEDENDTFKVLFDTGSSELWVPDELCQSSACLSRKRLARAERWTAKYDEHGNYVPILVKYLTGEMRAIDGTANVNLMNGIEVKDASVGLATKIDIPILMDLPWDGIVGLGFTTEDQEARGSKAILEALQQNSMRYPHFRNQFAYYISKTGGSVTFGGYNNDYKRSPADEFQWAPVSPKGSYWALELLEVRIKESENRRTQMRKHRRNRQHVSAAGSMMGSFMRAGNTGDPNGNMKDDRAKIVANDGRDEANRNGVDVKDDSVDPSSKGALDPATSTAAEDSTDNPDDVVYRNHMDDMKVIIDTGTYLIYAPQVKGCAQGFMRSQTMQNLIASLSVDRCEDKRYLPTLAFTVEGAGGGRSGTVELHLSPDDYVLQFTDDDGQVQCTLGIVVDDQQEELQLNAWTFGEVFLRAYYTVFDYDQRQIGFTPSRQETH
ncbi:aspartyl protease [Babesia caballi]|uniref:Aspartyl protease n=1 Tax=Babesia caballi TaxID=5871 RepID=A0AAV4LSZ1_BABCB|nr:aspartyl protease [Babesia caballi]